VNKNEYEANKKKLEDFPSKDLSPPLTVLDSFKKEICDILSEKYKSSEKMRDSGVCGIVDARKITSKRFDLVTLEFLFKVLKNTGYGTDVLAYKKSLIEKYKLSTVELAPSLSKYPESTRLGLITVDRLIEYIDLKIGFDSTPQITVNKIT
jgi:hypothetical protein